MELKLYRIPSFNESNIKYSEFILERIKNFRSDRAKAVDGTTIYYIVKYEGFFKYRVLFTEIKNYSRIRSLKKSSKLGTLDILLISRNEANKVITKLDHSKILDFINNNLINND